MIATELFVANAAAWVKKGQNAVHGMFPHRSVIRTPGLVIALKSISNSMLYAISGEADPGNRCVLFAPTCARFLVKDSCRVRGPLHQHPVAGLQILLVAAPELQ